MKNSTHRPTSLNEFYGSPNSGPLPAGAINWQQVAIYSGIAIGVSIVFLYGVHRINMHNTELWVAKVELAHDRYGNLQERVDKISNDVNVIKSKQGITRQQNTDASTEELIA